MIARNLLMFLLLVVLPDLYIEHHFFRRRQVAAWKRWLWWLPTLAMELYTLMLALQEDFIPHNRLWIDSYLWLLCLLILPKAAFALCSLAGSFFVKIFHTRRARPQSALHVKNYGHHVGILLGAGVIATSIYGFTAGFNQLQVKHVDITVDGLPSGFDGYRIAHVSDLHVGTYGGWRRPVLEQAIDSIRQAHPDIVCFTGDLQNVRPEEVLKVKDLLRQLPRTYSILGNHDYSEYVGGTADEREAVEKSMVNVQRRQLGWTLLCNEHRTVKAPNGDSIFIVGTENDGRAPFPKRVDYRKALQGIPDSAFILMLQHDPSAWRRNILPLQHPVGLTLSGHTHGGQVALGSLRPTMFQYTEDNGLYEDNGRQLYVSTGAGGLIPFRLGVPNEITVITLHSKQQKGEQR